MRGVQWAKGRFSIPLAWHKNGADSVLLRVHHQVSLWPLLRTKLSPHPQIHMLELWPPMWEEAYKEVIKAKRGHKGGALDPLGLVAL